MRHRRSRARPGPRGRRAMASSRPGRWRRTPDRSSGTGCRGSRGPSPTGPRRCPLEPVHVLGDQGHVGGQHPVQQREGEVPGIGSGVAERRPQRPPHRPEEGDAPGQGGHVVGLQEFLVLPHATLAPIRGQSGRGTQPGPGQDHHLSGAPQQVGRTRQFRRRHHAHLLRRSDCGAAYDGDAGTPPIGGAVARAVGSAPRAGTAASAWRNRSRTPRGRSSRSWTSTCSRRWSSPLRRRWRPSPWWPARAPGAACRSGR